MTDLIELCFNLKENCMGGIGNNSRELCYPGHAGGLCESCDINGEIWGEPYSTSAKFSCSKCSSLSGNIGIIFVLNLWIIISMFLSVKTCISMI